MLFLVAFSWDISAWTSSSFWQVHHKSDNTGDWNVCVCHSTNIWLFCPYQLGKTTDCFKFVIATKVVGMWPYWTHPAIFFNLHFLYFVATCCLLFGDVRMPMYPWLLSPWPLVLEFVESLPWTMKALVVFTTGVLHLLVEPHLCRGLGTFPFLTSWYRWWVFLIKFVWNVEEESIHTADIYCVPFFMCPSLTRHWEFRLVSGNEQMPASVGLPFLLGRQTNRNVKSYTVDQKAIGIIQK